MKVIEYNQLSDNEKLEMKIQQRNKLINKKNLNWGEFNSLTYLNIEIKNLRKRINNDGASIL